MITIWHNPRCSKSRETLALLKERDLPIEVREYLKSPPSIQEIANICDMLGMQPRQLMRKKESAYKELKLDNVDDDEQLLAAMARMPALIERPIVISDKGAALGRPPENVVGIL